MANTKLTISSKVSKETGMSEVLIQLRCGTFSQRTKSRVFINPKFFDKSENRIVIKERRLTAEIQEAQKAKTKIDTLCNILLEQFQQTPRESIEAGWAQDIIDRAVYPEKYAPKETAERTFYEIFEEYIKTADFSFDRKKHFAMIERMLRRYEMYTGNDISFESFTPELLEDFRDFLRDEHKLFITDEDGNRKPVTQYKAIYESLPEFRYPVERSSNYIFGLMKMLRAFCGWAVDNKHASKNPFNHFNIGYDTYGTPFYLTTEERDHIYESNFKYLPAFERQRDVFVFQCFVGCRVGDLYKLTRQNLVTDKFGTAIEYVPQKTMDEDGRKVKVYLSPTALAILGKYRNLLKGDAILPLVTIQKYNAAIKEILRYCGITRQVPVLNPVSGKTEMKSIADVASSHMARRTFVGNLYKKVKDPNLVGKLSGHKEGSRAFARYRDIDDEMIREMTDLL